MKDKLAKTLSVVYHPLFMPSFGVALLFSFDNFYGFFPREYKWFNFGVVWVFTLFIPLVTFWIMKKTNQISDYNISDKKERLVPMILTLFCYATAYVLLYRFNVPQVVQKFILGGAIAIVIAAIITPFWKISAHLAGIGGFAGAFFMISLIMNQNQSLLLSLLILMAGTLGWARLQLKVHTLLQVGGGFCLGFLVMVFTFMSLL